MRLRRILYSVPLSNGPPLAEGAGPRGPGLGAVALAVQLSDQQEGGAEVEEAPEDQEDQLGFGRVHHQLAISDIVAERRMATHEDTLSAGWPRTCPWISFAGELALELREREQDVCEEFSLPIDVVVQNNCVAPTKVTQFRSNALVSLTIRQSSGSTLSSL